MAGYFQKQLGVFGTGKIVLKKSLFAARFEEAFFGQDNIQVGILERETRPPGLDK